MAESKAGDVVYVWDDKKGHYTEVVVQPNGTFKNKKGVVVKPTAGKNIFFNKPEVRNPFLGGGSGSPKETLGSLGDNTNSQKPEVKNPLFGGRVVDPNAVSDALDAFDKSRVQGTPTGMTSQAPGGWNPKARFDPTGVRGGNTGDPIEAPITIADLTRIFESGGGSTANPSISRAALKKALLNARDEISGAYDTAGTAVASAMGNNPYAGLQAQETTVDPGLSALFQSQGVSSNPLEQLIASNREAAGQRGAAMNDMYKLLAGQFGQQAAQQQANIKQQRANSLDELMQNYAAILGSGKVY
jgi:hypothetical protein